MFLLSGNSNGNFGFTLKWQEFGLARIDSEPVHRNPPTAGGDREFLNGPHIHYYVPGYGLSFARPTDAFDQTDLNGALRFFLKHCNVVDAPSLQEVLAL